MRKIALTLAVAMLALPALGAPPKKEDVSRAKRERARAQATVSALTAEARVLTERFHALGEQADRAAARVVDAYRAELALEGEMQRAKTILNERASAAYRMGPGAMVAVFLDSESPSDFLASQELIERAIFADIREAAEVLKRSEEATQRRGRVERERAKLLARHRQLQDLRDQIEDRLQRAEQAARSAGLRLAALQEARKKFLAEQAAREEATRLVGGVDQSELLALLGPNKGRGCEIPPKLRNTGTTFSGTASWYGWDFAGQPTASGATYDPRLFTAAHKTLPLNSFIRVRWNGRCAILLVNDRGPFHDDWVLDLSQAAARYLGYERSGTAEVTADILARR